MDGTGLQGAWIWKAQDESRPYHQTIIARKAFKLDTAARAILKITADSAYRLFINGDWVSDGPCRAWPEHYQYDVIDLTGYLRPGENEIQFIARYWNVGTFHQISQQPGLLAQVEVDAEGSDAGVQSFGTDATWEVAEAPGWVQNTPKVSIQMEPQELYDARLEVALDWELAAVICQAGEGPWQDLGPRDVPHLTKDPFPFAAFVGASVLRERADLHFTLSPGRLMRPDLVEANRNVLQSGAIATLAHIEEAGTLVFGVEGMKVFVDGQPVVDDQIDLAAGQHLLVAFISEAVGHNKEKSVHLIDPPPSLRLTHPLDSNDGNPWAWIPFPEYDAASDDLRWPKHGLEGELASQLQAYLTRIEELGPAMEDAASFRAAMGDRARSLPWHEMFVVDSFWPFTHRDPVADAGQLVENPSGLIYDNAEITTIHPSPDGAVELLYDLGEQVIGYYELDLTADAGVEIDIYEVEYIDPAGRVQHTWGNRNGMRYITRQGRNCFTSLKRRSGRYVFVTLRNQHTPVHIRNLRVIASTYPVNAAGSFRCSDEQLTRVWEISARTLRLCMEDTFTDCPLYEQTLWVGDARNEAVFAYPVFGATDRARRCVNLAAQSLERYPIVGCQVPSTWDVLLPAWSFLWGISIWDYYQYTGDADFVREMWPAIVENLKGADELRDPASGLFKGPFWNMFDWTGIDDGHEIVLHNSMLMVGAIDAALGCAEAAGAAGEDTLRWLNDLRRSLCNSLNALWDPARRAYPDSLHKDGGRSPSTSQHTSFLALLYNIAPAEIREDLLANVLDPPEGMIRVGSPFAMMYYYEALELVGLPDAIIQSIRDAYIPMLAQGATTVWEVFPSSDDRPGGFPTRSHCHAWSSAPVYFLNRIILGVKPVAPGGSHYEISPRLQGLGWAEGAVVTARGTLHAAWRADETWLHVHVTAPDGVEVRFVKNDTHGDRDVTVDVQTR
jgi:alpha-L-rhamnosidase